MKRLYALGLFAVPLFLAAGWIGARTVETEEPPQQEVIRYPAYGLESQHFAVDDMGRLLERLGREIQQDQQVTFVPVTCNVKGLNDGVRGLGALHWHGIYEYRDTRKAAFEHAKNIADCCPRR